MPLRDGETHATRFDHSRSRVLSGLENRVRSSSVIRKRAGEISYQLLRYDHDANHIVHFSVWSSLDNARRFFESPELVEIRKQAGVKAPEFIYLHEIERGVL